MTDASKTTNNNIKFEDVYIEYYPLISTFLRSKIKNEVERDVILEKVFDKVLEHLSAYSCSKGQLNTWIYTIVNNKVRDYFRKVKTDNVRFVHTSDLVNSEGKPNFDIESNSDEANEPIENNELHRKIRRAIRTLRPIEKTVAILRLIKEYSYSEIAETLDIPENSVKVYLMRAKESLQSVLKTEYAMLG
jgi:RNA polymerase sigma-70 factor (ECF subfamily)